MLVTGVGLWAEDACARPEWVTGTWSVTDGRVRRVGNDQSERAQHVGFIVPGMADAHCHIGYSDDGSVSPEEMVNQAGATLASGVTLVRDCGVPVDNSGVRDLVGPRLIRCGRHVARPKRYMRGLPLDVEDQRELPGVLADMARGSDGWVKIVGDWIDRSGGADSDLMPLWDPAVLVDAVCAVHEAGARIAVHAFSHRVIDSLIEAGVDDIEHGSGIDANQASEIAARGIAVTPTLRQVELFRHFAAQAGTKYPVYAATMQAMYDNRREHFQMLLDVVNASIVVNRIVHKFILITQTIFCDINLLVVWIIFLNPHDLIIKTLRIDNPIPISFWYMSWRFSAPYTLNLVLGASFFTFSVVNDFRFTVKVAHPITHIVVNS